MLKLPSPIKYANDHPWIYVVLAFLLLIAVWTTFIILAVKSRPLYQNTSAACTLKEHRHSCPLPVLIPPQRLDQHS